MRLLISVDGGSSNGWEGFNFIVNRNNPTAAAAKVEKFNGGWKFSTAGSAKYSVKGNTMTIAIPKSVLGISASGKLPVINFKWVDNAISAADGDILDVYTYGDAAPDARFTYRVDIQDGVQKLGASSGTASSVPTPTAPAAAKPTASPAAVPTAQATADVTLPNTEAPSPGTLTPGGETETPIQSETPTADDTGSPAATAENTGVSDVTGGGSDHATDKNSQETENSAETAGVPSGGNGKKSSSGCYGIAGGIIAVIIAAGAVILIVLRKKKGV